MHLLQFSTDVVGLGRNQHAGTWQGRPHAAAGWWCGGQPEGGFVHGLPEVRAPWQVCLPGGLGQGLERDSLLTERVDSSHVHEPHGRGFWFRAGLRQQGQEVAGRKPQPAGLSAMCACVCMCVNAYMCVRMHVCIHVHERVHMHVRVCPCACM